MTETQLLASSAYSLHGDGSANIQLWESWKQFYRKDITFQAVDLQSFSKYFAVTCSTLSLQNGRVSYDKDPADDGHYPVNTIATFTCDDEHYLDGDSAATCESSSTWSQQPMCRGNNI